MTKKDEVAFIKDYEPDDKFERINIHKTSPSKEYFRCILWGVCEKEAISILNHSVLEDRGILWMDVDANKMPGEVIKERAFWGTYFREIYSGVTRKWHKK